MRYGYFDDLAREYVITTPYTPQPWINYLGNEEFFGLVSNNGGGYCFYRDAKLQRLIRYRYNNVPADIGGRFYYIKDGVDRAWSPTFHPCDTPLEQYECRHGLGYTVFKSSRDELDAKLTMLVPQGENCEVHQLTLKNRSSRAKSVKLYGVMEWCLWNAVDDSTNFQRNLNIGEVEIDANAIYHKTEYRERRDHYAYYGVNADIAGYDTDRDAFLGKFSAWNDPICVRGGASSSSVAHGNSPIAALRVDEKLEPNEEKTFIFVLGYAKNPRDAKFIAPNVIRKDEAKRVLERFSASKAVERALEELNNYWRGLLSCYQVKSGDDKLDRMVNIWNQYQCMVTFNMSRSASFYESGTGRGMGFRDSCQDLLGFVHLIPTRARERIIDIASIQWEDGSTYHQYQPLTKRGNNDVGSGFNDDPLWLVACTYAYIAETGDYGILEVQTPFDNKPGSEMPLMEHLRRSVNYTYEHRGPHGLPLIGRADWNDCLNLNCFSEEPGESFQTCSNYESGVAESVFIAGMFVKYAREYADICQKIGRYAEAVSVRAHADEMAQITLKAGWDGEWFIRAFDAFSKPIGSSLCEEGKIFIEPQGMCVMAGIGVESGEAKTALNSVRKHLLGTYGVELLAPCYTVYHKELGEISSYPPGYKENGSVFCHNNPWISIAETVLARGDNAFDIYQRTCPAYLEDKSDVHATEPYVYSQTVAARASFSEGEAKNSWLTGTAAWAFVNISQAILGVKPTLAGLKIEPCLPGKLDNIELSRRYRGAEYKITIKRTGKKSMKVNGCSAAGNVIAMQDGVNKYIVEVTI